MLNEINSKYILMKIVEYIPEGGKLKLFKCNKKLQNLFKLTIDNYKTYTKIEIEIFPIDNLYYGENKFINKIEDKSLYHIYFNEEKKEINKDYITNEDKISKIKIILASEITSLKELFYDCECIKK